MATYVLYLPADGSSGAWYPADDLEALLPDLLGGPFEMVSLTGTLILLVGSHATLVGLPRNVEAGALAEHFSPGFHQHSIVHGPAVFASMASNGAVVGIGPDLLPLFA